MTQAAPLTLDVRPELRAGGEPFPQIMQARLEPRTRPGVAPAGHLRADPALCRARPQGLRAPRRSITARRDWEILFTPDPASATEPRQPQPVAGSRATGADWPAPKQVLDNRGLQPPEPMVRILSALEQLAAGEVIEAWNDREPLLLYPELEARGAAIQVSQEVSGVRLLIRRGG